MENSGLKGQEKVGLLHYFSQAFFKVTELVTLTSISKATLSLGKIKSKEMLPSPIKHLEPLGH